MSISHHAPSYIPALGYNSLSNWYDRVIRLTMPESQFRSRLAQQLALKPDETVLDFGFGTGSQSILLKKQMPEATITGVDIDPNIRELALKKVKQANLDIQLDLYDGNDLPYPNDHFDKVVSCLVFHQLDMPQKKGVLGEIYRVLKSGGEFHIGDWGEARHAGMRLAFLLVQLLDGFTTTRDNVKGLLPNFIADAGFQRTEETNYINTWLGTFSFYKAQKPYSS